MGFKEAVLWWEEWQLRLLVLCSLFIQFFLLFAGILRKCCIPSWFRLLIWLAYVGSDAVVIYALATLFNRHKEQGWVSSHGGKSVQLLWAPILLVHLGGQNGITAYNIEDNELWRRHVLTAISQVTVAVYVFSKSLSGETGTVVGGCFLFFFGILKCIVKPWDLKRASINSLFSRSKENDENFLHSFRIAVKYIAEKYLRAGNGGHPPDRSEVKVEKIHSLHQYVGTVRQYFLAGHGGRPSDNSESNELKVEKLYDLLVDLAPSYSDRYSCLKHLVHNGQKAHRLVRTCLSLMFDRLYSKQVPQSMNMLNLINIVRLLVGSICLPVAIMIIALQESSDMKAYNDIDVKITSTLLFCTAILECVIGSLMCFISVDSDWMPIRRIHRWFYDWQPWPDQVAQYSLIGYLARNKRHSWFRKLATLLGCKDYVDQLWCMKPFKSSRDITELIHGYIAKGWTEHHIKNIATYRAFNDNRGNWTLKMEGCGINLEWSLRRPFDESVLLWHLATDFCFHRRATPPSHEASRCCREMSNYMAYLLFVNPEMLITGTRRNLFKEAYKEIQRVLKEASPGDDGSMNTPVGEKELTLKILEQVMITDGSGAPHDARWLAHYLMELCSEGEDKMWRVIQGVWVEMLCFSAGRCRGYLHAKNLGKGGEYLSYVWLLMSYMGMETLAERMQRMEVQEEVEEDAAWRQSCRPYIPINGRRSGNNV